MDFGDDKLGVVPNFYYLGDMLSAGVGNESSTIARIKSGWKKFRKLPILTSSHLSHLARGNIYSTCVCSAMLYAAETWSLKTTDLQRLLPMIIP